MTALTSWCPSGPERATGQPPGTAHHTHPTRIKKTQKEEAEPKNKVVIPGVSIEN